MECDFVGKQNFARSALHKRSADQRNRSHRRAGGTDKFEGGANEGKAVRLGGGQFAQAQIFDDDRPPIVGTVRNFLRHLRGVHKKYLAGYIAICEFAINLKRISPAYISLLVTRTCS